MYLSHHECPLPASRARLSAVPLSLILAIGSFCATLGESVAHCATNPWAVFASDPNQKLERTCFQTGSPYVDKANLRSDVAIVYGIDRGLPDRIQTWRDRGYRIHVMTGVSWGEYQDYLYGRFDGINHEDEAQTVSSGKKISHGGDVYYMCPGTNFGKFLCVGVQRALDAGAEAIHLEEPEFWVNGGYSEGFKREWRSYYKEEWQAPQGSTDAQWRASKLKYYLYGRALQQVFEYVHDYNRKTGRKVRCYVPTHSLINYAHWRIVSPESSLARVGCDGYIAQVWTGTARTKNEYRGKLKERTFETAFLEYGAMQNLVRATGRDVWYLNDPIEDNPNYDWEDYRVNWESTLVASLFQTDVSKYEVAPWPERIFGGKYPSKSPKAQKIPPAYATELQTVMNSLNDMKQKRVEWDSGTTGIGLLLSDSLMFQRGQPTPSDEHMGHLYGMALPFLKRGMPMTPVQLENLETPKYLDGFRIILMTYQGMKPLTAAIHLPLAEWVQRGGILVVCDDDKDPCNTVREWWNSDGRHYATPREHLFELLGLSGIASKEAEQNLSVKKGRVLWIHANPASIAKSVTGGDQLVEKVQQVAVASGIKWRETNYLKVRRGPYIIASGLDESIAGAEKTIQGRFVNLFDAELRLRKEVSLSPGARLYLMDIDALRSSKPTVLASACKVLPLKSSGKALTWAVEGVANTPAIVLMASPKPPKSITLAGNPVPAFEYSAEEKLLWIHFPNESTPRNLEVSY